MAATCTGADSLQVYLTGASAPGRLQRSHHASLGGYRSSVRAQMLTVVRRSGHRGIIINHVSGMNGVGLGCLKATGPNALAWKPPGAAQGAAVEIAAGETKLIPGQDPEQYIIVSRTSAEDLAGDEYVQLLDTVNNAIGMSNYDWAASSAEQKCRALMLRNCGDGTISDIEVWIDDTPRQSMDTNTWMAFETPSGGALSVATEETDIPTLSGLDRPIGEDDAISGGALAPGEEIGLWLRRHLSFGYPGSAIYAPAIYIKWTFEGVQYTEYFPGQFRVANTSEQYQIWISTDGPPDMTASPSQTTSVLPVEIYGTYATEGEVYVQIALRNRYGLIRKAQKPEVLYIGADGSPIIGPPTGPDVLNVMPGPNGTIQVSAAYYPERESLDRSEISDKRANTWLLYISGNDTPPDPETDEPIIVNMSSNGRRGESILTYVSTAQFLENEPVHVLVRTRRDDGENQVASTNMEATVTYADWAGPARPRAVVSQGRARGLYLSPVAGPSETIYIDETKNIRWEVLTGETRLWADDVLIWNLRGDSVEWDRSGLLTTFAFLQEDISGEALGDVEVAEWTTESKVIYLAVNGTRRLKIDVTAGTIHCAATQQDDAPVDSSAARVPYWVMWAGAVCQVWAPTKEDYETILHLDSDGVLSHAVPWLQCETEEECLS